MMIQRNGFRFYAARYNSPALAAFAAANTKAGACMLGDDGKVWVVTLAVAERLARMGYDWA